MIIEELTPEDDIDIDEENSKDSKNDLTRSGSAASGSSASARPFPVMEFV